MMVPIIKKEQKMNLRGLPFLVLLMGSMVVQAGHHEAGEHALSEADIINIAKSAAPENISDAATIMDAKGRILVEGTNGWTCMPGTPPNENVNPMCVDKAWQKWLAAFMSQSAYDSETEGFGMSYMLQGDQAVDNNDPFNTDRSQGVWIQEGPHLMILMPASLMKGMSRDPYAGGPYVMWEGNDFVHVMVPLTVVEKP